MSNNGEVGVERVTPEMQGWETLFLWEAVTPRQKRSLRCLESDLREQSRAWTEAGRAPSLRSSFLASQASWIHLPGRRKGGGGSGRSRAGHGAQGQQAAPTHSSPSRDAHDAQGGPQPPATPNRAHPADRTFTLGRVLTPVPEDVDLVDGSVRLKKFFQLLFRPRPGDLPDKHLNGIWVWLVWVIQSAVHLVGCAVTVKKGTGSQS